MSFSPKGIIPAVWTPLDANGKLLRRALGENIGAMVSARVDALLILGSTGEFLHLTVDLRKELLETALEFAGRTPVLVNISDVNPHNVIDLGRHAQTSGAKGVSLLPPWFYPLNEDDLVEFFVVAAEAVDLPLVLYNFHAMTGKRLTPQLVRRIGERVKIGGLKHSAGDMDEHRDLVAVGRDLRFNVVTGWDTHLPEAMALGVRGCVAGLANVVPELLVHLFRLLENGGKDEAAGPARQMRQIGDLVGTLEFPLNVAAAMEARGREVGAPKSVMSASTRARYHALNENMRALLNQFGIA